MHAFRLVELTVDDEQVISSLTDMTFLKRDDRTCHGVRSAHSGWGRSEQSPEVEPDLVGTTNGRRGPDCRKDTRRWPTLAPALDLSKRGGLRVEFPSERIYVVDQVAHEWLSCMLQPETRYGRRDSASSTQ